MALSAGQRLGPYEVLSPIGAGGMGEVYRARDPRLGRDVAIKVLPALVAAEPERLQRFEREARAASALSHPNIITVYDVGTEDSIAYIAIEFIDGMTLRDMIVPGPLPIRRLLDLAVQIAGGLATAHEAGIIHRDLKPRNVMISRAGFVKILDFGLAKVAEAPAFPSGTSRSETAQAPETTPGQLLGTTDYMSPEQARGKTIDFRSDQFSFGAVLYEMATGRRAFGQATPADTLLAILQQEPTPIAQLRPDVPAPLRWIIERCLAKSAADRYASTQDLAHELQSLKEHISEVSTERAPEPNRPPRRRGIPLVVAVAVCLTVFAIWLAVSGRRHPPAGPLFRRLTFRQGLVSRALFVPNSNSILYSATWDGDVPRTFVRIADSLSQDRSVEASPQVPMGFSEDGSQVLAVLGLSLAARGLSGTLAWVPERGRGVPRNAVGVGKAASFLRPFRLEAAPRLAEEGRRSRGGRSATRAPSAPYGEAVPQDPGLATGSFGGDPSDLGTDGLAGRRHPGQARDEDEPLGRSPSSDRVLRPRLERARLGRRALSLRRALRLLAATAPPRCEKHRGESGVGPGLGGRGRVPLRDDRGVRTDALEIPARECLSSRLDGRRSSGPDFLFDGDGAGLGPFHDGRNSGLLHRGADRPGRD